MDRIADSFPSGHTSSSQRTRGSKEQATDWLEPQLHDQQPSCEGLAIAWETVRKLTVPFWPEGACTKRALDRGERVPHPSLADRRKGHEWATLVPKGARDELAICLAGSLKNPGEPVPKIATQRAESTTESFYFALFLLARNCCPLLPINFPATP